MKIICCDASAEAAQQAFRLRYKVFGSELNFQDPDINAADGTYIDELDKHARIYVAIKDGEAIATARAIYDRDLDFATSLPPFLVELLNLEKFTRAHSGSLAVSTKFAIAPDHRGSLAAHQITAKMFSDFLDDGIQFLFSMCAPYLLGFYSQLGFQAYSRSISDSVGLVTPIVLVTHDWEHLKKSRSPLHKQIAKRNLQENEHPSVRWFHEEYGSLLGTFVTSYDDRVLEKISPLAGGGSEPALQDVGIFHAMTQDDVRKVIGSGKLLKFAKGDAVIQTGNATDEMFVVVEGGIEVSFRNATLPTIQMGPGQVFGEIAMLSRTARTADCVATADTQLAIVSRQNLERLMKVEPEVCSRLLYNLSRGLSRKLIRTNEYMKTLVGG